MTKLSASEPIGNPGKPGPGETDSTRDPLTVVRRSLVRQVARDVLVRWGAQIGIVWVGLLVVLAVLAPVLANSHPLLMKSKDGELSSPWVKHLSTADCTLLVTAVAFVIIVLTRWRASTKVWLLLAVIVVTAITSSIFVKQRFTSPDTYRDRLKSGEIEWAARAPIPYSPDDRQLDDPTARLRSPAGRHWMGTTATGADLASNMIHACRIALSIGFISTGIAVVIGVVIGGMMGYFAGVVDLLGMRLVEIFSAIPTLLLLLCFVAVFTPNLYMMMAIIGLTSWEGYAVFTRAEFLSLRQRDFVQSAIASGVPLRSVLFRHMLPNGITPVLISASFGVASAILAESTLSFLGIGLGVDEASWGKLLADARSSGGTFYWWLAVFPGVAIFLTVFAYNLIGEALRDALDPKVLKN